MSWPPRVAIAHRSSAEVGTASTGISARSIDRSSIRACGVELTVHGRHGARLGHSPGALEARGDEILEVGDSDTSDVAVAAEEPGVGRLAVSYGDFGPVPGPEIVGVAVDDIVRVEILATKLRVGDTPQSVLQPIGYTADGTAVACVPVIRGAFESEVRSALAEVAEVELLAVDCSEYPCATLVYQALGPGEARDWPDLLRPLTERVPAGWEILDLVREEERGGVRHTAAVLALLRGGEADAIQARLLFHGRELIEAYQPEVMKR